MAAGNIGAETAGPITTGMFATGVAVAVFWGTLLAVLLGRLARRPARAYLVTASVLTALSLAGPALAAGAARSTRAMPAGAHLLAAVIVIPPVVRSLRRRADR